MEEFSNFSRVKERINIVSTARDCLVASLAHNASAFPYVYRFFFSLFLRFVFV